jgi:two-component system, chemotaxis family, CheB/CheR fusion protein
MTRDAPLGLVAIGASAGGIEAFRQFFAKMPPDSGLAFVVVLHLAAGRKSMLPEILARWTTMPVAEAYDGVAIKANYVLVIPPGTVAQLRYGHLWLLQMEPDSPRSVTPIDAFFDSVAASLTEGAIGVILSGTGHDGSLGLKAIKARGGLTLAQGADGSGPEYPGMPDSAVAAGAVDLYVRVEDMPERILAARPARLAAQWDGDEAAPDLGQIRMAICDILRTRFGHDFSQYKPETFLRRVQRRMQVTRLTRYNDFIRLLETDREQVVLLFRDLLISVTSFFRDAATFAVLESDIIPGLFSSKDATSELRIWVPGCATGEEAYSLAILVREHMDKLATSPKVQIFASDIDEVAIGTARAGRFPATLLEGMAPERRSRFFAEGPDGYLVRQEVRELCTFSAHSLIRDPPFSRIDMISCRNLLIYMGNDLQDRVIPIFHYALVPKGILVLGSSETIAHHERLFQPLNRSHRIFVRRDGPSAVPSVYTFSLGTSRAGAGIAMAGRPDPKAHWLKAVAFANRRILERFASPFVVVNAGGEIVHFSSQIGRFLEPAPGSPTTNLFDMARQGWGPELRAALRRCIEMDHPVEQLRPVVAPDGETTFPVKLAVEPLPSPENDPLYMIAFVETDLPRPADGDPPPAAQLPEANAGFAHVERENRDLRERLQSIAEQHATALEELRSSNEELQSVNEELQSTNEELETSREEMQSINEELNTVNAQLSAKVEQLDRSNGDLKNLFDSTKVATVFLDPFLIIRSFTPEIAGIYNLIPADVGRPLTDIASRLTYTTLREDVQAVLRILEPLEKRVERQDGSAHYLMRILPYRSPDSTVDGSLITFVDVTSIVRAEEHQRLLVDELNHRVKNMLTVVISLATNTLRQSETLEAFQEVFLGRIHALTAAYALLSRDNWSPVPLREILMEELRPFLSGERANAEMTGPAVLVQPRTALALGMAAHELITNAVKFGALSSPDGKVDISWTVGEKPRGPELVLKWVERNGPPVTKPARRGFGMALIERAFAHDVDGEAEVNFLPEGVVATLRAPLPGDKNPAPPPGDQNHAPLPGDQNHAPLTDEQPKETP